MRCLLLVGGELYSSSNIKNLEVLSLEVNRSEIFGYSMNRNPMIAFVYDPVEFEVMRFHKFGNRCSKKKIITINKEIFKDSLIIILG